MKKFILIFLMILFIGLVSNNSYQIFKTDLHSYKQTTYKYSVNYSKNNLYFKQKSFINNFIRTSPKENNDLKTQKMSNNVSSKMSKIDKNLLLIFVIFLILILIMVYGLYSLKKEHDKNVGYRHGI